MAVRCWVSGAVKFECLTRFVPKIFLLTKVAMWVLIFTLIMLAFEGVYVIKYVTRFTEEIFAFLIASVFLTDALKKVIKVCTLKKILN